MASLPLLDSPLRREIIEIRKFDDEKSTLESSIKTHHFNHAFDVFIPGLKKFPSDLIDVFADSDSEYYIVRAVTLDKLLDMDFIGAFVKKGKISVLSDGTRIDVDNSVCVYHPGNLVISLMKDDYEELGLPGKPSSFDKKVKPTKYVVKIDLLADSFFPGKNGYDRALKILQERKHLKFDLIFSWVPHDDSISCRSLHSYLLTWGYDIDICVPNKTLDIRAVCLAPTITSSAWKGDEKCGFNDFMEFLGCLTCGISFGKVEQAYYTREEFPLVNCQWTGFLSSELIFNFTQRLKNLVVENSLPWAAVVIHGFDDVPVSWQNEEHSYATANGDNLCTIVIFPDSMYWMCKGLGPNDFLPNCKPSEHKMDE